MLLDLPIVTEGQPVALHELQNTVNAERFPADPPMPYETRRRSWRTSGTCWAALSALDGLPIANVWIGVPQTEAEQHLNDSPHRSITIGNTIITPELLRQREHEMDTHGQTRWTMYVREQITGEIVGFSEVSWHKHNPEQVEQGVTGVLPAYRKRGIGH